MTARTPIRETSVFEASLETVEKSCNVAHSGSADTMRFVRRTTQGVKRSSLQETVSCFANHKP